MKFKQYLASLLVSLISGTAFATQPPSTADWAHVSNVARRSHSPVLVLFSTESCGYCERLKKEVIEPLKQQPDEEIPLIREFDINKGGKITDFNGEPIRSRQFKRRYHIFATPTLLILDADGHPLSDPIVGYNSAPEYLELFHTGLTHTPDAPD